MINGLKLALAKKIHEILPTKGILAFGAGSTVNRIIDFIGSQKTDLEFLSAASSTSIKLYQNNLKEITLGNLQNNKLNLLIDGADLVILKEKIIIKGLGGAPTQEKILWHMADNIYVVVDQTKMVIPDYITIPVEIIPNAFLLVSKIIHELNSDAELSLRTLPKMEMPFLTDLGNYIIDLKWDNKSFLLKNRQIHNALKATTGVVETGIFLRSDFKAKIKIFTSHDKGIGMTVI